ncbi:hypothetical protein Q7C36_003693 [Tachysurus vachellii]|uniref:Uncharacterized protein n=1 Tax=Tachysurus vachellii TaxID=175792 RepID=A0AA88T7N0_TACVA|nr:uncharacterized protein si:ch211-81a5.8 [Tachysurus vachellii]KAK2864539.1 hypothetical protein Q7C36_003693 [Tachysurus vachellii]
MDAIVKKSLAGCISGVKDEAGKKGKAVRRKSAPCCYSHITYDSSWIRAYQAELQRERKLRQGILAQKKVERTVLKVHYRNPHHYTKAPQDRKHLKTKASSKKDDSLFGAFRGLSLNIDNSVRSFKPTAASAEQCKVM